MLNRLDRLWVVGILFLNGWYFALPVTEMTLPVLLTPVQVIHGVFLHEFLLLAYIGFQVIIRRGRLPIGHGTARNLALLITFLGCLGVLSTGMNLHNLKDLATASRYFLFAEYCLLAILWAEKFGPVLVLQSFLLGIVCSGIVNLYFTYTSALLSLGGLPLLLGQNGPGGYLGILVILSAWLMLERKTRFHAVVAVISGLVGVFAASISYSKLSMLIAGLGVIAWGCFFLSTLVQRRSRRLSAMMLVVLAVLVFESRERLTLYMQAIDTFITYKFRNLDERAVGERSQYIKITAEIVGRHPVGGVGYSGFYDAVLATQVYQHAQSAEEDPETGAKGQSNPHNSFLYYAAANGLPGLMLSVFLFVLLLRVLWQALSRHGMLGKIVWSCLASGYFIFAVTLPTLFNTSIMYLPAAVGVALVRQKGTRYILKRNNPVLTKWSKEPTTASVSAA